MPDAVEVTEALANPDLSESAFGMERAAGLVRRHDLRLQGPIGLRFRSRDQTVE